MANFIHETTRRIMDKHNARIERTLMLMDPAELEHCERIIEHRTGRETIRWRGQVIMRIESPWWAIGGG